MEGTVYLCVEFSSCKFCNGLVILKFIVVVDPKIPQFMVTVQCQSISNVR